METCKSQSFSKWLNLSNLTFRNFTCLSLSQRLFQPIRPHILNMLQGAGVLLHLEPEDFILYFRRNFNSLLQTNWIDTKKSDHLTDVGQVTPRPLNHPWNKAHLNCSHPESWDKIKRFTFTSTSIKRIPWSFATKIKDSFTPSHKL